jgi:hypothetical protein
LRSLACPLVWPGEGQLSRKLSFSLKERLVDWRLRLFGFVCFALWLFGWCLRLFGFVCFALWLISMC